MGFWRYPGSALRIQWYKTCGGMQNCVTLLYHTWALMRCLKKHSSALQSNNYIIKQLYYCMVPIGPFTSDLYSLIHNKPKLTYAWSINSSIRAGSGLGWVRVRLAHGVSLKLHIANAILLWVTMVELYTTTRVRFAVRWGISTDPFKYQVTWWMTF